MLQSALVNFGDLFGWKDEIQSFNLHLAKFGFKLLNHDSILGLLPVFLAFEPHLTLQVPIQLLKYFDLVLNPDHALQESSFLDVFLFNYFSLANKLRVGVVL